MIARLSIAGAINSRLPPIREPGPADVNFLPIYGQSLAVGGNAEIISSAEREHGYMFSSIEASRASVRPQYNNTYLALATKKWYTGLAALREQNDDSSGDHMETPCCGAADMIHQLIAAENGSEAAASYKTLMSAPGYGGISIAGLSTGAHLARIGAQLDAGLPVCCAAGKSYATQAVGWIQGEQDYVINTPRTTYRNAMIAIQILLGDMARACRQSWRPPLIYGQIASHLALSRATPTIALAQDDAEALAPTLLGCASVQYIFDHSTSDNIHIDSSSTRWFGAAIGLTVKRRTYDGLSTWDGAMRVISAIRNGDGIDVTLDPIGDLVLDTSWVSPLPDGNYGFQVVNSGGTPVAVQSVTITGPTEIRVACAAGGGIGSILRYGWAGTAGKSGRTSGARGNLRDSYGDNIIFKINDGDVRPMHRWLRITEIVTN